MQRSAPKALSRYSDNAMLRFALSHNALTLRRKVIASFTYLSRLIEIVIASYSYRFGSIVIVIAAYSYRSLFFMAQKPVNTLAQRKNIQRRGGKDVKE
jgi:hypothetical protein